MGPLVRSAKNIHALSCGALGDGRPLVAEFGTMADDWS